MKRTIFAALTIALLTTGNSYANSEGNLNLDRCDENSINVCFEEVSNSSINTSTDKELTKRVYKETGLVSWYYAAGKNGNAGVKMSSNSAAHRTIPYWTNVSVTSNENGKGTDVVILDRGPFVSGVILDIDKSAFSKIHNTDKGRFNGTIRWM
jgi:rare lipoprotein A